MILHIVIILACLGTITLYNCCSTTEHPEVEKIAEEILEEELGLTATEIASHAQKK